MTGVLIRIWPFEDIDIQGEYHVTMKVENEATSQGVSKISGKPPEAEKRQKIKISLLVSEEARPCQHFDLGLLLCERIHFYCYKPSHSAVHFYAALRD